MNDTIIREATVINLKKLIAEEEELKKTKNFVGLNSSQRENRKKIRKEIYNFIRRL